MDLGEKLRVGNLRSLIDLEDMRKLPEQHAHTGRSIPLISAHLAGLGCQTKALLAFSQCPKGFEIDTFFILNWLSIGSSRSHVAHLERHTCNNEQSFLEPTLYMLVLAGVKSRIRNVQTLADAPSSRV